MQIRRLGVPLHGAVSAPRELFCCWGGTGGPIVLATYDITIWDDGEVYQPQPVDTFVGAVVLGGCGRLGTIASYPFPFPGNVAPIARIDPDPALDLDALPTWDSGSVVPSGELPPGVGVVVSARGGLHGRIGQVAGPHRYPDPNGTVQSLVLSDLPTIADRGVFGAPVVLESQPDRLVGMLLTADTGEPSDRTTALCYPAYLL